jgi:hypothetical protein
MKGKILFVVAVAGLSLAVVYVYQSRFMPAQAPDTLEYLTDTPSGEIHFVSSAMAGEQAAPGEFDFSDETVGAPPKTFTAAVGNWIIGSDDGNKVLVVDGRKWKQGVASAGLADKARSLYGDRYAEFLDNVTAYAYYPFAVAGSVDAFTQGTVTVKFKAIAGRIDQGAGILFDLKPNGDYYALRANPLENNLVLWRYKKGRRSSVTWVRNVNTPSRKWHSLKLTVEGKTVKGYVNGKHYLTRELPAKVSGKVGLWTKADSVVYFDDYRVEPR